MNDHVFNHNMIINQKSVFDLVTRGRPEKLLAPHFYFLGTITIVQYKHQGFRRHQLLVQ